MYHRILCPIDGSPPAQRGLDEAMRLARRFDASVVLLHVVDAYPLIADAGVSAAWTQLLEGLREAGQRLLDRAHDACTGAGIACEAHLENPVVGRVCDVIVEYAREHRCDLIVMGTHGRRGLTHALIGSDAERVARMSPVPLLLVRAT